MVFIWNPFIAIWTAIIFNKISEIIMWSFNIRNINNLWLETGDPDRRSEYYTKKIKLPSEGGTKSNSYYDTPWHYSTPREINVFLRIDYK